MKIGAGGLIATVAQETRSLQQVALQNEPLRKKENEQQTASITGVNNLSPDQKTRLIKLVEELNKAAENLFGYAKFNFRMAEKEKGYAIEIIETGSQNIAGEISPEMLPQLINNPHSVLISGLLFDRMV